MTTELTKKKRERMLVALQKLEEFAKAEPAGDPLAQERSAANFLTQTIGISRPLSDRYVAEASKIRKSGGDSSKGDAQFSDEACARVTNLDDRFGAAFMVLPHHVDQILKGGKHMSRRFRRWGDEGDVFHVRGKAFRFNRIEQLRVGNITEDDIRKEGYSSREEFEQMWYKSHPKSVAAGKTLDPDQLCWCHEYEPCD